MVKQLSIPAALAIVLGLAAVQPLSATETPAQTPSAKAASELRGGDVCTSRIELPQGKEELTVEDVVHAVRVHLVRVGLPRFQIEAKFIDSDLIGADILDPTGKLARHIEVDAADANIVYSESFRGPVGFAAADPDAGGAEGYRRALRRHVMGDGTGWAEWLSADHRINPCFDDYRLGGPDIN